MTKYWFFYEDDNPQSVYRATETDDILTEPEYYNHSEKSWLPSENIIRYVFGGEIGYEETTEEEALEFIESKSA